MNKEVCESFLNVWEFFPDTLTNNEYHEFKNGNFLNSYCNGVTCGTGLEKINAGCLFLFNKFFGNSGFSHKAKNNINFVDYIMIWLIYMLSLKENSNKNSLKFFHTTYINSDLKYKSTVDHVEGCSNFKDIIEKRHTLTNDDMDYKIISELYNAFKLLCEMYIDFDEKTSNCAKCSEKAKKFVEKYKKLIEDHNNTNGSSYNKILSTLSTDYDNLKNKCNGNSSFPSIETMQSSGIISEDASSSSSIGNKLISVLSIFGAIAFLLGISYKYSLFGFRKRGQKQYLREKIKKIKKKMNH
ncbi:hypothetical protein YYC_02362 [Plasmodium yoelii 17X]|uniref:PIR protein n=3 Tax=Plasmodium yoelii TaxID=5861 RepID=A0AAE9WJB7_PLAYO|nr:PIR protein [Plasmodium yoelii]ETB60753.1 hypothetical protein YYC_02362 [Plasmodium yoelii 17X]WBY54655.1 PIR protein [Plasmodium yoelii yoelii]CDU16024.1 YIR protein [Plasmodium yoelii]VTZ71648.1 PIR protein [Plasmodium yoelii]|eukprot:XP_022810973.1 PIR protein [Plasmodium yoelii]